MYILYIEHLEVKYMNFYGIRDLSNNTKNVMTSVSTNKKVIITDNGKPSAIMLSINEANFETVLSFVQKLEMQLTVSELQKQSLINFPDGLSDEDIQKEIEYRLFDTKYYEENKDKPLSLLLTLKK